MLAVASSRAVRSGLCLLFGNLKHRLGGFAWDESASTAASSALGCSSCVSSSFLHFSSLSLTSSLFHQRFVWVSITRQPSTMTSHTHTAGEQTLWEQLSLLQPLPSTISLLLLQRQHGPSLQPLAARPSLDDIAAFLTRKHPSHHSALISALTAADETAEQLDQIVAWVRQQPTALPRPPMDILVHPPAGASREALRERLALVLTTLGSPSDPPSPVRTAAGPVIGPASEAGIEGGDPMAGPWGHAGATRPPLGHQDAGRRGGRGGVAGPGGRAAPRTPMFAARRAQGRRGGGATGRARALPFVPTVSEPDAEVPAAAAAEGAAEEPMSPAGDPEVEALIAPDEEQVAISPTWLGRVLKKVADRTQERDRALHAELLESLIATTAPVVLRRVEAAIYEQTQQQYIELEAGAKEAYICSLFLKAASRWLCPFQRRMLVADAQTLRPIESDLFKEPFSFPQTFEAQPNWKALLAQGWAHEALRTLNPANTVMGLDGAAAIAALLLGQSEDTQCPSILAVREDAWYRAVARSILPLVTEHFGPLTAPGKLWKAYVTKQTDWLVHGPAAPAAKRKRTHTPEEATADAASALLTTALAGSSVSLPAQQQGAPLGGTSASKGPPRSRGCERCGKDFVPSNPAHKFCTSQCARERASA